MKNLNEDALMQDMNESEMANVNGGWIDKLFGLLMYCFDNRDDIKAGLADGAADGNARF